MSRLTLIRANRRQRTLRTRAKLAGTADRPRLCVIISARHVYAQVINDDTGQVVTSASTVKLKASGTLSDQASQIGKLIAQNCHKMKVKQVVFDRGRKVYHGRLEKLAVAARKEGLKF